jgi:hypothetical protein
MPISSTGVRSAALLALAAALPTRGRAQDVAGHPMHHAAPVAATRSTMSAGDLRVALHAILREHIYLTADMTNAALRTRPAEYRAAAAALDRNSVALARVIGSVYGGQAQAQFLPLWRKHIGFFVDYTTATAAKDRAKQQKAIDDLKAYSHEFGAFLYTANSNLPAPLVADLVQSHALGYMAVIDAQAAGDLTKAYEAISAAAEHMGAVADPLADAIAAQFPARYPR